MWWSWPSTGIIFDNNLFASCNAFNDKTFKAPWRVLNQQVASLASWVLNIQQCIPSGECSSIVLFSESYIHIYKNK